MSAISVNPRLQIDAWVSFLRAHSAITRQLNADLLNEHGLTLNDYEVLLCLAREPNGMLRRVDLAQTVILTASGITRLLDGLERAGYVERASRPSDARVSHTRFSEAEQETLAGLLGRLPQSGAKACAPSCG